MCFRGLPERIAVGDDLVVRRYNAADIPHLVDVVNANIDHLRPFMPWAQEPVTVEAQLAWWQQCEREWEQGTGFVYGVYGGEELVGGTGYHVRNGPGVLEIGYWLAARHTGCGVMTRVAHALTEAAARVPGVAAVEIHCDEANLPSAAIPRRLGYRLVRLEPREITAPGESGVHQIWSWQVARAAPAPDDVGRGGS